MSKSDQVIHGRPTQKPLNREEQKQMFEIMQKQYGFVQSEEKEKEKQIPQFPIQPIKDVAPTANEQLEGYKQRLLEYGIKEEAKKVETHQEENKTTTTIKQFYCQHIYNPVRVSFMGMPMRYKICSKCGLVK
jgi:hypothetical protein